MTKPKLKKDHKPVGRPSKYSPAYCTEVVECLSEGHSVTAFAGRIGVARSSVFKWAGEYPEFSDALKVGQAKAVEYWESRLKDIASGRDGNATAAIFGLKNRASDDWRDRQEVEHSLDGDLVAALEAARKRAHGAT